MLAEVGVSNVQALGEWREGCCCDVVSDSEVMVTAWGKARRGH